MALLSLQQSVSNYEKTFHARFDDYEIMKLGDAVFSAIIDRLAEDFVKRHGADILAEITNESLVKKVQAKVIEKMADDWKEKVTG